MLRMRTKKWFDNIGPGPLVAAAFIGPGTVTICTVTGVEFGYSLLWVMGFSIIAIIVLQEMAARLGIISQKGLAEIIRENLTNPTFRTLAITLILAAIVIGNAAYEAGNISGGVLGLEALFEKQTISISKFSLNIWSLLIGLLAFILLYLGNYKMLEKTLVGMVLLMSLAFIVCAIMVGPEISKVLQGIFQFRIPNNSLLTIVGLIGTTIVPYNLFLHASLVKEKWHDPSDLKLARKDTFIAVVIGGLVSMCIVISAASINSATITNASDLAKGLEPLFGSSAKYVLSIGLFAAGITSAITAPLAAAYVATGCLGWNSHLKAKKFRLIWILVLIVGVICSSLNIKSITIIKFSQIANGILLPIIVGFLISVMNSKEILGKQRNRLWQNLLGFIILGITILLSFVAINKVFQLNLI